MSFLRRPLRLAIRGPSTGLAYFKWNQRGDPILESWEAEPPAPSWRLIRRAGIACAGVAGSPFLHLDIRTPYGESLGEEQVLQALREALGPQADAYFLQGWHVAHLEDTHMGSNHRVFASLGRGSQSLTREPWDQRIPLELAVAALGDWLARSTGRSVFQLVLTQDDWIYSLVYRNAQPFHLLRLAREPSDFALKRLQEHHEYARQGQDGSPAVLMEATDPLRADCEKIFKTAVETPPMPADFSSAHKGANLWHFALALAAIREDANAHNQASLSRQDRNLEIRLLDRLIKTSMVAALLGCAAMAVEAARYIAVGRNLVAVRSEAEHYSGKVAAIQTLREEKKALWDSLSALRPLWQRPIPLDRVVRGIAEALPPEGGVEGILFRKIQEHRFELSFRGWVGDWNRVRPLQEKLQRLPFFSSVEFSDQRQEPEHNRVAFQAVCTFVGMP